MKGSYNDASFLYDDKENLIGVNLSADFTAEHEWGVDDLRKSFKCDSRKKGLPGTRITKDASTVGSVVKDGTTWFYITSYRPECHEIDEKSYVLDWHTQEDEKSKTKIKVGWDGRNFAVLADREDPIKRLKAFFAKKDVFISLGGGHVFKNAGLVLVQASTFPKGALKETVKASMDHEDAKKALENSKGFKLLMKKQVEWRDKYPFSSETPWSYIALSPHGDSYWLNPQAQKVLHWGGVTLQDVEDWANEKKGAVITDLDAWEELKYELSLPLSVYSFKKDGCYRKDFKNVPYQEYLADQNWQKKKVIIGKKKRKSDEFVPVDPDSERFLFAAMKHELLDDMFCQIGVYHYDDYPMEERKACFQRWIDDKPKDKLKARDRTRYEIEGILRCLYLIGYGDWGYSNVPGSEGSRNLSYLKTILEAETDYDFLRLCGMLHKNWE